MIVYDSDSTHLCRSDSGLNLFYFSHDNNNKFICIAP